MADDKNSIFELLEGVSDYTGQFKSDWKNEDFRSSNQSINPTIILLNKNRIFNVQKDVLISFKPDRVPSWYNGEPYKITLSSSNSTLKMSTTSWIGEGANMQSTIVSLDKPGKVSLYIAINGIRKKTFEIEFMKSKDVFTTDEVNKLKQEYSEMAPFVNADDDIAPSEYTGNYCMQGADRALGKLLNNKSDFYLVNLKTHEVINLINFGGLNTYSRAEQFRQNGYIESEYTIDSKYWKVDHKKRENINNAADPDAARTYALSVLYSMVWVNDVHGKSALRYLKELIDTKEQGWHVYYMSIIDGFHTQILLINNSDRENPTYEIWEDRIPPTNYTPKNF